MLIRKKGLREMMCDDGWPHRTTTKNPKPNPLACAECECICAGGIELLQTISDEEFRALLCGGDCGTCRQPCNLRRLALARNIKPAALVSKETPAKATPARKTQARKTPNRKTWLSIALRPYMERMREK